MVVYELLGLQVPFANVEFGKRDTLIKENKRPPLQGRGIWSPLMAQSIMRKCWAHDPDERPTMKEITQCIRREEFSRLRAEISLEKVESVSCACVCRITPEEEQECATSNGHGIGHIQVENSITSSVFDAFSGSALLCDMDPCTEYTQLQYEPSLHVEKNILPSIHRRITSDSFVGDDSVIEETDNGKNYREQNRYMKQLSQQKYSQVWVCDRKEKGLLEIFTYYDSQAGYYVSIIS